MSENWIDCTHCLGEPGVDCLLCDGKGKVLKMVGGLTHGEIIIACRNMGINLECGGCAENFYTGFNDPLHHDDKICAKKQKIRERVKVRKIAGSICVSLPKTILNPLSLDCGDMVLLEIDLENSRLIVKRDD